MFPLGILSQDRTQPAHLWKERYWRKKGDKLHEPENYRLCQLAFTQAGVRAMIRELFECEKRYLDPPDEFRNSKLETFLLNEKVQTPSPRSTDLEKAILLDERKDPNSFPVASRDWDEDSRYGYFRYPP